MRRLMGVLVLLLTCFGFEMQSLAGVVFVKGGEVSFEIDGTDMAVSALMPGESRSKQVQLKNETAEMLCYAVQGVVCTGSMDLMQVLRCSLFLDSEPVFSDTLEVLCSRKWEDAEGVKKFPVKAGETQLLELVVFLDLAADNRVMGESCDFTILFQGKAGVLESESESEDTKATSESKNDDETVDSSKAESSSDASERLEQGRGDDVSGDGQDALISGNGDGVMKETVSSVRQGESSIGSVTKGHSESGHVLPCEDERCGICRRGPGVSELVYPELGGAEWHETVAGEIAPGETLLETQKTGSRVKNTRERQNRKRQEETEEIRIRVPKTGDTSQLGVLAFVAILSLLGMAMLVIARGRGEEDV